MSAGAPQGVGLVFEAAFTNDGAGATGLTVLVYIYDEAGNLIVNGGTPTEIGRGLYRYTLSGGSVDAAGAYVAVFTTAGTVDQSYLYAWARVGRVDVSHVEGGDATDALQTGAAAALTAYDPPTHAELTAELVAADDAVLARLGTPTGASIAVDLASILASVGLRLLTSAYTTPPAVGAIADAVWDELLAGHAAAGSAGAALTASGGTADPMTNSPDDYEGDTLGALIARLRSGQVTLVGGTTPDGEINELIAGADYSAEDGRQLDWTHSGDAWPEDLTDATVTWCGRAAGPTLVEFPMTVVTPTGTRKVRLELTAAQSATLGGSAAQRSWAWTVWAVLPTSGRKVPLVVGVAPVPVRAGPPTG